MQVAVAIAAVVGEIEGAVGDVVEGVGITNAISGWTLSRAAAGISAWLITVTPSSR